MPAAAEAVHGLSATFLSDKPRFHEKAAEFLEFIGEEAMLVAHNAGFDFGFINSRYIFESNPCFALCIYASFTFTHR